MTLLNSTLTSEHRRALAVNHRSLYEKVLAAKKKTDADFKNSCKKIIAEGTTIDQIKLMIELDTPEGEAALKARIETDLEVARWAGAEVGKQFEFNLDSAAARVSANDRAYDAGKMAGYKGVPAKVPDEIYEPGGEDGQAWLRGHHDGQQQLMAAVDLTKAGMKELAKEKKGPGRPKLVRDADGNAVGKKDGAKKPAKEKADA